MASGEADICSHVRVVIRVRPPNEKEKLANSTTVVQVVDNHIVVFDPKVEEVNFFHGRSVSNRDVTKRKNKDLKFVFDGVFGEDSSQLEVFEQTTKIVLDGFLNGYNCTVLAYGATGAGKTHTMLGCSTEPGVMYLTMMDLYSRMDSLKDEKICNIAVSYLEVYNEQIRDLLSNSGPLAVREDAQKGVVVQGLSLHQPKSAIEILQLLDYGNKNRTQHPTDVNATSSRSHAVFQIYLRQQDKSASINQNVRIAKMSLIDLAGSERASATNAKGDRLREGTNINRSLLALGNVINALADPKTKKQHIPYRNSKLTRLLKDSLGGNCRTIMIAAVSPSSLSYDDTYNTLKYANRAKDIKSSVKSNVVSLDSHISQYVKICEQQKKEIAMLKEKLKTYEEKNVFEPAKQNSLLASSQERPETKRYQDILYSVFSKREEIRAAHCHLEMQLKENELKSIYQRQYFDQIQMLCSQEQALKATNRKNHRLEALKAKQNLLQMRREDELKRFDENTHWLHRVENEMKLSGLDNRIPKELSKDLQCCHLKLEVKDLKSQIEHMNRLVCLQEREYRLSEKLLNFLLPAFRRQYEMLREAGLSSAVVESDFQEVEHLVQREKAVVWADQTIVEDPNKTEVPDVASIISFPQLIYSQTTPCRGEKHVQMTQMPGRITQNESSLAVVKPFTEEPSLKENVPPRQVEDPPFKRTRRKLMQSPQTAAQCTSSNEHEDSLSGELVPIVYTPDNCNKTILLTKDVRTMSGIGETLENIPTFMANDKDRQKMGFTFQMKMDPEHDMDSTVILSHGNTDMNPDASGTGTHPPSMLQRLGLPSLLSRNPGKLSEKPSYMAMTSAAERKRKLLSLAAGSAVKEDSVPLPVPKRVRQDNPFECKALRVKRTAVAKYKDSAAQRRLPRSVSDGNLAAGARKKQFSILGSSRPFSQAGKKQ
ncbi:PREDICTED: kinesin-like protein KIF18A [Nanorana parkeri]|uniref:kinesin-like protein KIF18A n=1 Tax=Nanorana parkeri TaxID=125878 RepID=UPI0008549D99|nr:PREDICTED: kinesin-like protein KIF18A [Nanorana parkeri]